MEYVLKTNCLTKQFKKHVAVDNVNLHIKKNEIYGFIGRNGAGKTTFLKMISGLTTPSNGEIELFGAKGKDINTMFNRIGILIEAPGLYPGMNAYDNLKLKCICMGIHDKGYIEEILEIVGLSNVGRKKIKNYSLGMKQRLGIGMALIGNPDLLVLDEPINGLDPQGIVEVRETIIRLNKEYNMTIIISSHILEELSKIATQYGIIHEGRLIEELSKDELFAKCNERIVIETQNIELACTALDTFKNVDYKVVDKNTIHVFNYLDEVAEINATLLSHKVKVTSIGAKMENIESYFLEMTGGKHNA